MASPLELLIMKVGLPAAEKLLAEITARNATRGIYKLPHEMGLEKLPLQAHRRAAADLDSGAPLSQLQDDLEFKRSLGFNVEQPYYHITGRDFGKFIPGGPTQTNKQTGEEYLPSGPGMWFSDDYRNLPAAHNVGSEGANVRPVFLDEGNPFFYDRRDPRDMAEAKDRLGETYGSQFPYIVNEGQLTKLSAQGFDSIKHAVDNAPSGQPEDMYNEMVVFDPEQISGIWE